MTSPHRSTLTRCIGNEPMCHYDVRTEPLMKGDFILHCSDGLYGFVLDDEILAAVIKYHPGEACKQLLALTADYHRFASDGRLVEDIDHLYRELLSAKGVAA